MPLHINPQHQNVTENVMNEIISDLNVKFDEASCEGSGWSLHSLNECAAIIVATHKCMIPIKCSSVGSWCALPSGLRGHNQIKNLNPRYAHNYNCLDACIRLHLSSKVDSQVLAPGNNKHLYATLWNNYPAFRAVHIKYPPFENNKNEYTISQFSEIENKNNISLVIYMLFPSQNGKDMTVSLVRKGKRNIVDERIIYLLQTNGNHVCYIKNLVEFLKCFMRVPKDKEICVYCFVQFKNKTEYQDHITSQVCQYNNPFPTQIVLPPPNSKLRFKALGKTLSPHLICYADSESILIPNNNVNTNQEVLHIHQMISFAYVILNGITGDILTYNLLFGNDVSKQVIPTLRSEYQKFHSKFLKEEIGMYLTEENEFDSATTTHCVHCNVELTHDKVCKTRAVKHHDHCKFPLYENKPNGERKMISGNYIATICSACNLRLVNKRRTMNINIHNGGGYDLNLFLKDLDVQKKEKVFMLPKQANKFYTIKIGNLAFIDTLNYFPFSLSNLADSLTGENGQMNLSITHKILQMKQYSQFLIEKTIGKGSFPYEHMKSIENFDEKGPPPKECFHSSLTGPITDEKYREVCETFKDPEMNTVKDLHDIYIASDVGILADVGEYYRKFCRKTWDLDPANYITSASLYMDACLKESKQELDLISDPNLYEIMEKSICGGFVTVVRRKAYANNIHVPEYDPTSPNILLLLLDFNGLYAGIQESDIPIGFFKLLSKKQRIIFTDMLLNGSVDFSKDIGYWLEVDYHIPPEVARKTDELPLSVYVADNIRGSNYMRNVLNGKPNPKGAKLVATHLPMKKAVFHIKWLDLLMKLGLKVDRVHRVWSFKQKPFLKSYVIKNIEKRAREDNVFLKAILKLASNAPYGKFLEQKRKRNVRATFVTTPKGLRKHARSAFFRGCRNLGNNKCIVERFVKKILLDVPIYVGSTILQLAKHQYWDFYYNVIKANFGDKASLIYGDTDSMLLEFIVDPDSSLEDLLENTILKQYIDRSNFKDSSLKDDTFKGKSGYLKSETADDVIRSAILLKPKLYSIKTVGGRKMASKGISMRNIDPIPHKKFEEILEDSKISVKRHQTNIRRVGQNMCTVRFEKETINAFENKRWWEGPNISYGYGHPDIKNLEGGSDCNPIRFETEVDVSNDNHIIHAAVEDDEMYDDLFLQEESNELESDDDEDILLYNACAMFEMSEAEPVSDEVNESQNISMQEDVEVENTSSPHPLDILVSMIEEDERNSDLKRKSIIGPHKNSKKTKQN